MDSRAIVQTDIGFRIRVILGHLRKFLCKICVSSGLTSNIDRSYDLLFLNMNWSFPKSRPR